MATDPQIAGFAAEEVRAGLLLAMQVGLPPKVENRPHFVVPAETPDRGQDTDARGVPLDWRGNRTYVGQDRTVTVPCAVEVFDREGQATSFGVVAPYRAVITLLDKEYEQVKGFKYVVLGGNRYRYLHTEPPVGLVSIEVWTVHVVTDDEA